MSNKIAPKTALYAYTSWLSTRRSEICLGANHECSPVADTLVEFQLFNPSIDAEAVDYDTVVMPVPTYFSPSSRFYEWEVKTIHLPWTRLKKLWARCVR